jgi:hypothetical protein
MTLYGFYTDESGNNGFGDIVNQPVLCYGGLLVPIDLQISLNSEVSKILDNLQKDIKLRVRGIPEQSFKQIDFFKNFELHGKAFIDGEDFYYNLSDSERFKVVEDILSLIQDHRIILVASVINKYLYQHNTGETNHHKMHIKGYTELVNLINKQIYSKNGHAFVIADDGKPSEISNFLDALQNTTINTRVYPDLQLKLSHDTRCKLIQVADLISFITSVFFRDKYNFPPRKRHQARIVQFYNDYLSGKLKFWEYR